MEENEVNGLPQMQDGRRTLNVLVGHFGEKDDSLDVSRINLRELLAEMLDRSSSHRSGLESALGSPSSCGTWPRRPRDGDLSLAPTKDREKIIPQAHPPPPKKVFVAASQPSLPCVARPTKSDPVSPVQIHTPSTV